MLAGIGAISVPVGLYRMHTGSIPVGAGIVTMIWTLVTLLTAVSVAVFSHRHAANRRGEYRFPLHVPVTLAVDGKTYLGLTSDLSPNGALYVGEFVPGLAPGNAVDMLIHLPNLIVRDSALATFVGHRGRDPHAVSIGLRFQWDARGNTGALESFLYGSRLQLEMGNLTETETPPLTRLAELLRREGGRPRFAQSWGAGLLLQPLRSGTLPVAIATLEGAAPLLFSSIELDLNSGATLRQPAAGSLSDQTVSLIPTGRLRTPTGDFHLYNFTSHSTAA